LIKIHLKPEAAEYAEEAKLRELVAKYSEFINFPIYMEVRACAAGCCACAVCAAGVLRVPLVCLWPGNTC
jgi:hypothetical protein